MDEHDQPLIRMDTTFFIDTLFYLVAYDSIQA